MPKHLVTLCFCGWREDCDGFIVYFDDVDILSLKIDANKHYSFRKCDGTKLFQAHYEIPVENVSGMYVYENHYRESHDVNDEYVEL